MHSKRSQEGYLLISHKDSPGLTQDFLAQIAATTSAPPLPVGAGRGIFEAPTFTCSHCQKVSIINPLRNRDRAYCGKCDHYLCDDPCAVAYKVSGGVCQSFRALAEKLAELAARAGH
jgi:hypothetical protein